MPMKRHMLLAWLSALSLFFLSAFFPALLRAEPVADKPATKPADEGGAKSAVDIDAIVSAARKSKR